MWAKNMLVVRELTIASIEATVHQLMEDGEFESAFAGPFEQ